MTHVHQRVSVWLAAAAFAGPWLAGLAAQAPQRRPPTYPAQQHRLADAAVPNPRLDVSKRKKRAKQIPAALSSEPEPV